MNFFSRLMGTEKRANQAALSSPYLAEFFNMRGAGGSSVSSDEVLSNSAVAVRCVALRSELLASVGLHLFRRDDKGSRSRATDHPLYAVLHDSFNDNQTAFEAREFLIRCLDLHGNAYFKINRNARGQCVALIPLMPGFVVVQRLGSGRLRYKVSNFQGGSVTYLQDEILHVRGPSRDGLIGQSVIQLARGTLGLNLSQVNTANSVLGNSLRTSGIVSFAEKIQENSRERLRTQITNDFTGPSNAGKILILDNGGKFDPTSMTPEDAQFLESRKLSNEDVARIFNVPPTAVGILDKGTYNNVEQEAASLIQNCLGPLAARIEAAMARCLLTPDAKRSLYIEHDLNTLLRGDVKSRFEAYRVGREIGAYSANDVRRRENESPISGGDAYHMPANWVPLNTTVAP